MGTKEIVLTALIAAIIFAIVVIVIINEVRTHKKGKCSACGSSCAGCGANCEFAGKGKDK